MNYDKQKIEAIPYTETQRAETAANKFFDMAEKARAEEAQYPQEEQYKEDVFSSVGRETAQGNFDKGQRILEGGVQWDDNLRGAASEINQLDQERNGTKPMSFEEAQKAMGGYARDFEKISKEPGGRQQYLEGAMAIDNIVADTSEPGIEGIDEALKYIEGTLKSKNNVADSILKSKGPMGEQTSEFLKDWQEKRAIRDALYQEKQRRIEQQRQSQKATAETIKERSSVSRVLENLYAQTGTLPSRESFLMKVQQMSAGELHFLDAALKKTATEFARTQNPKILGDHLTDLVSRSFKPEDVMARQKEEDKRRIEEIRAELGIDQQDKTRTPIYEKVTDTNLERYGHQKKEIVFGGQTWRIDTIYPDGRVALHRDITISEAIRLAEMASRKQIGGGSIDTPGLKTKGQMVDKDQLISNGQWIIEKPPRSPNDPERQKEVEEINSLRDRVLSKEFPANDRGQFELLEEVWTKNAERLIKEKKEYEKRNK